MAYGVMPMGGALSARTGSIRWLSVEISMVAEAWCLRLLEGSFMEVPSNKLKFGPLDPYLEVSCYACVMEDSSLPLFLSHQGDGEGE
jgi:hypothetical protein